MMPWIPACLMCLATALVFSSPLVGQTDSQPANLETAETLPVSSANPVDGPALLAVSDQFFVHAIPAGGLRVMRPEGGLVLTVTNRHTGELTTHGRTGLVSIPTVRRSYSRTRMVGAVVRGSTLFLVMYASRRSYDVSPKYPMGDTQQDAATFRLMCIDLETGAVVNRPVVSGKKPSAVWVNLPVGAVLPKELPAETVGPGVLKLHDQGLELFGCLVQFDADGTVASVAVKSP